MALDKPPPSRRDSTATSFHELHHTMAVKPTDTYPIELHHIKALLLHKQYRHCIRACRDVLGSASAGHPLGPLSQSFVAFYLALAHDELARIMHPDSRAKIPSFDQAEKFYRVTLIALPSVEELLAAQTGFMRPLKDDMDAFNDNVSNFSLGSSPVFDDIGNNDGTPPILALSRSPPSQLPRRITTPSPRRNGVLSPHGSDANSQGSFANLLTPTRMLPRDASRMSLIATPPSKSGDVQTQLRPLPRNTASMSLLHPSALFSVPELPHTTSYSLLRPVRLGSPARPYTHHQTTATNGTQSFKSRLPKLNPAVGRSSTPNNLRPIIDEDEIVSPLGSESMTSGASAVSPISSPEPFDHEPSFSYHELPDDETIIRLSDHLDAMRIQLHAHLRMLSKARQETIEAQNKSLKQRQTASPQPLNTPPSNDTNQNSFIGLPSPLPAGKRVSIASLETQAMDKKRRIAEGRERKWARERFRPERYRELAEKALSEL